ncbi:hypothetical protein TD95_001345 [Thielaviopsis punctulata]|uniref:Uncharacterized protein n=1 Tax=Thielaviopsis punctulata TaxID=72032 RepID=A0A0F4ZGP7_9PEZI|nr:hypothetical protein TD95_001345 [Thielaviopsis punctulata]
MSFPNIYVSRRVADTASKGCDICYKATTTVLFSEGPDGKDFFYVCPTHLKDNNFCAPIVDTEAEKQRLEAEKKKAIDAEIEKLKEEYEAKKKAKENQKDKDKGKDQKHDTTDEKKTDKPADSPKQALRTFYNVRKQKRRDLELAKRQNQQSQLNRERMAKPDFWPSVPQGAPKK